jgi:hypothetical protein
MKSAQAAPAALVVEVQVEFVIFQAVSTQMQHLVQSIQVAVVVVAVQLESRPVKMVVQA